MQDLEDTARSRTEKKTKILLPFICQTEICAEVGRVPALHGFWRSIALTFAGNTYLMTVCINIYIGYSELNKPATC